VHSAEQPLPRWDCRWEKAIKTHTKPYWIRLPSRLPPALLIWFIGGRPLLASAKTGVYLPIDADNYCHGSAHLLRSFTVC
jgi:hypothetical protein